MTARRRLRAMLAALSGGLLAATCLSSWATQTIAARFDHHPALGEPLMAGFYQPFAWITWQQEPWSKNFPRVFLPWRLGCLGVLVGGCAIVLAVQQSRMPPKRKLIAQSDGAPRPIERGVTDNHGHAAWASQEQMAALFEGPGCLIGAMNRSPGSRLLFANLDVGPGHSLIFAGPGSHKSVSAVTRIWHWNGPRVVFDPSCEIGPIMTPALQAAGCRIVSIGIDGKGLNVLDWIDPANPETDAHLRTIIDHIWNSAGAARTGARGSVDPFWENQGRALAACLLAHMIYHPQSGTPKTLASLRRGIATPEADMAQLLSGIHQSSASSMARDIAGTLMGMRAPETFSGILSNANAGTEWLSVGAYADIVSGDAMKTSDILDPRTVVFVQIPLRTLLTSPAVGRAVIAALFNALFAADGRIKAPVLFQLDEAKTLGPMKEILLCYATARKYRGVVSSAFQSEAQLEDVWGREGAKTLRDSVSWRSYNAVQDGDIAERLSRDIGSHAVLAYSEGDNRGTQRPWQPMAFASRSAGLTVNAHEVSRRLIKADEIMRAPADEMWVLARDCPNPIRCVTAPYFRFPDLASRMAANRFARVPT